jgi:Rod binding domain-containing protein
LNFEKQRNHMKPDFSSALGQMAALTAPASKGAKAARDFESVLLTSLLDSLQKAFALDAHDSMPGAADYRLMGTRALAEAVSSGGGIGIAELILRHLPVTKVPGGN